MSRSALDCPQPPPSTLATAIRQFNSGQYFACHETLEDLWLDERTDLRYLYQGILQIGVGLLHLQRGNAAGARSLLERGPRLVRPFAPTACGIDLANLLTAAEQIHTSLRSVGLEGAQALLARHPPQILPDPG